MRILDRYVLNNFLLPFAISFAGFLAIWLVFDLADNAPDFIEARASLWRVAFFYATQFPAIMTISLPAGILLALLYSLSRMSRANEIISMLTAGVSVLRILVPLLVFGLLATGVSFALNYELAPKAGLRKKRLLAQLASGRETKDYTEQELFRNRTGNRTWFIQRISPKRNELEGVHVTQQDAEGNILAKYYARRAVFDPVRKTWRLYRGMRVDFNRAGEIISQEMWLDDVREFDNWPETPWRMASSNLKAQDLSVPELRDYLRWNSDFPAIQLAPYRTYLHHRLAVPWSCLVIVFVAAPLGIVYSRRGVLSGVAWSIFIFFGMIFLTNFFLALGEGARISPALAGWLPNLLAGTIGLFLLHLRAHNREMLPFKSRFSRRSV